MNDNKSEFVRWITERPLEVWFALVAGIVFVMMKHDETTIVGRIATVTISVMLGLAWEGDISVMTGLPRSFVMVLVVVLGYIVLEIAYSLFGSAEGRDAIKNAILRRIGGDRDDKK